MYDGCAWRNIVIESVVAAADCCGRYDWASRMYVYRNARSLWSQDILLCFELGVTHGAWPRSNSGGGMGERERPQYSRVSASRSCSSIPGMFYGMTTHCHPQVDADVTFVLKAHEDPS